VAGIRHELHPAALAVLLHSPTSGTAKDMLRRGIRVQSQARRFLGGGGGRPTRIDTGLLRSSIYVRPVVVRAAPGARVGTAVWYARLVHDGTGIYGPRGQMIKPLRGRYLVFTPKGGGGVVFARQVRGMKPNAFLKDALVAAKN
jgi:hypothetical protein